MRESPTRRLPTVRLAGLDAARGLAVLAMFPMHLGSIDWATGEGSWILNFAGRATALFTVLAGVALALLSGGSHPPAKSRLRYARVRIAVRAVMLAVLGLALAALGGGPMVILTFYAVYFLLCLPLLRLRARTLAALAAALAVAAPLLSYWLRSTVVPQSNVLGAVPTFDSLGSLSGLGQAALDLLLTGAYPALTALPLVLAGMAIGRSDLRSTARRLRILVLGAGVAILGYGGSWLTMHTFGADRLQQVVGPLVEQLGISINDFAIMPGFGTTSTQDPVWLLIAQPHSGSLFDVAGTGGLALALIAGLLMLADRFPRLVAPLRTTGTVALTLYAAHIIVLWVLTSLFGRTVVAENWLGILAALVVLAPMCAMAWRRWVGRGPLEWLLHNVSVSTARMLVRIDER